MTDNKMTDKTPTPGLSANQKATVAAGSEVEGKPRVVVIDIGKKQSKKAIKRLRQGRGKLMPKIDSAIKEIQQEAGSGDTLPVVVVVERKKKASRLFW